MGGTIKIKDNANIAGLIIPIFAFPIVLMILSLAVFNENYLLGSLSTFFIYTLYFVFYIKYLIKKEHDYVIQADNETINIKGYRTYKWEEISEIYTFEETYMSWIRGRIIHKQILKIRLENYTIELVANSFDMDYKEIAQRLKRLGS